MTEVTEVKLEPGKDFKIVLDQIYYTISGAMKKLGVGKNVISNSVNDGTLTVFNHPSGYLFSEGALFGWIKNRTITGDKIKKKKK